MGRHPLQPELRAGSEELRLLPGPGVDQAEAGRERRLQHAVLQGQPGRGGAEGHADRECHVAGRPEALQAGHPGRDDQL